MNTNWTPGPWWYQEKSDAYTHIVRAGENRFIAQFTQDTSGVSEANARLTAAGPEMYEALLPLEEHLPLMPDPDAVPEDTCIEVEITWRTWGAIRAALSKARGPA